MRTCLVVLAGCASAGAPFVARSPADLPPVIEPLAPAITFGPVAHPAATYEEPIAPPAADPICDELYAQLPQVARDPRLDVAAAELADVSLHGVSLGDDLVEFALHAHGVVERGQALVAFGATAGERLQDLLPGLGGRLAYPNARIGIGGATDRAVVVIVYTTPVHLIAMPRDVTGGFELHFTLDRPYDQPRITITRDDRTTEQAPVTSDAGGYRASITCGGPHPGRQWIAIEAAGVAAPLVVVPVGCRLPPDPTYRVEPDANLATRDVVRRLTALINRERLAAGLAPLSADAATATAAQRYAETMHRRRDVAHDLEGTTPTSRLAAVGRVPPVVDETTLETDDLRHATDVLLNDPLYREQVVAPEVTHLGVGVAIGRDGELFVAIDYLQIHPAIDPAALEAATARQIASSGRTRRLSHGVRATRGAHGSHARYIDAPPTVDADLTRLARRYAAYLALGWPSDMVAGGTARAFTDETVRYHAITRVIDQGTEDWRTAMPEGLVVDNVGIGVAQAARGAPLCGRVFRVVIVARY